MQKNILEKKKKSRQIRKLRVRGRISGTISRPRISIFRSNRFFYAQAIDDVAGAVLSAVNGKKLSLGKNKEQVAEIGKIFAQILKERGISSVVFDRNGYLYHGVVASFADSLRENGISL